MADGPCWLNQPSRNCFISGRAPQEVTATKLLQYPYRISTEGPETEGLPSEPFPSAKLNMFQSYDSQHSAEQVQFGIAAQ